MRMENMKRFDLFNPLINLHFFKQDIKIYIDKLIIFFLDIDVGWSNCKFAFTSVLEIDGWSNCRFMFISVAIASSADPSFASPAPL